MNKKIQHILADLLLLFVLIAALPCQAQLLAPKVDYNAEINQTVPWGLKNETATTSATTNTAADKSAQTQVPYASQPTSLPQMSWSQGAGSSSIADCPGAKTADKADIGNPIKPDASSVFDTQILEQMQNLMVSVYSTLSQISMFGHSLVCYAQTPKLGATEIKLISWDVLNISPSIVIWDFSMLICGVFVFIVGVLMSYAIGMYFIDISFKIGFAVLFLPVTVALWPFKPTSQKFMDNLFIIIRNSMLFALVAITVAFSSELIAQGLHLDDYWTLVDMGTAQAPQVKQLYSLSTTKFLVIAFVLIFSFKILTASVEKFLDYFFNDPAFGSESPMHQMGTQAVGMAWNMTGRQVLSYAGDVALNATGKAMIGAGNSLDRMSKGDFSDIRKLGGAAKSLGSAVIHPLRTTRRAAQGARDLASSAANSTLRAAGEVAKDLHDIKSLFKVGDFYEQEYEEKQAEFAAKVDRFTQAGVREATKQTVAAGLAKVTNAGRIIKDTAVSPFQAGSVVDRAVNTFQALKGENSAEITTDDVRQVLHVAKQGVETVADNVETAVKQAAPVIGGKIEEGAKTAVAAGVAFGSQVAAAAGIMDTANALTTAQARATLHSGKESAEAFIQDIKQSAVMSGQMAVSAGQMATAYVDQHTQGLQQATAQASSRAKSAFDPDKTSISLHPSALISAPFKAIGGVRDVIDIMIAATDISSQSVDRSQAVAAAWQKSSLKQAADTIGQFAHEAAQEYGSVQGGIAKKAVVGTGKVIIKKSGQIVVRSLKGSAQDAGKLAQGSAGVLSKVFIGFGKELTSRGSAKSAWDRWNDQQKEEEREKLAEQEKRLRNQTLTKDDD